MIITEQALGWQAKCPLIVPMELPHEDVCAHKLMTWALKMSFEGKFRGFNASDILHVMRGKILQLWNPNAKIGTLARTAAFRLFTLITDYQVLHLEQPYSLILSGYTIQGKYALLRKRRGEKLPYLLIARYEEPDLKHDQSLPPDLVSLARYVHLYRSTEYKDARILNYSVFRGRTWVDKGIDIPLATSYLESMLKVLALRPRYPVMGRHCYKCSTKPCMEVFNNGQNDNNG